MFAEEDSRRQLWEVAARVLSEEETTALWLHYVEALPLGEVAAVLGQSRIAVKVQMFRAGKKLLPEAAGDGGMVRRRCGRAS